MIRLMQRILLFFLVLIPLGCNSSTHISESVSSNAALFDPTTSTIPLPNVLATATASDPITQYKDPATGLVGLRRADAPMNPLEALAYVNLHEVGNTNAVSGVNSPIYIRFTAPLVPATVNADNIKVFQITADTPLPTATENRPLGFTDITPMFTFRYTAGTSDVQLFPNFPLLPGTRYLYLVTDRVKDAQTGAAVSSSVYFDALKATSPLGGPFAPLEPIRANTMAGSDIAFSGYAKTMDDLIAASATTKVSSRNQIALLGRFITTTAGFVAADPANPVTSLLPVETALRAFAAGAGLPGGLPGKNWLGTGLNAITVGPALPPLAFWTGLGLPAATLPPTIGTVATGSFTSADISMNPVAVHNNPTAMNQGIAFGTYSAATSVVLPFRDPTTHQLTGFYHSERQIPFIYIAPAGTAPAGGWPLVIFQHGITGQKEQVAAVAGALTSNGFAVVAIDLPLHGGGIPGVVGGLEFPGPGHTSSDQWGTDFIALGAPLATRSNLQQAAFNLHRLELVVATPSFNPAFAAQGFAALGAAAPNPSIKPKFVGLSLGSIVGAYYLAGNTTLSTAAGSPPYTQTSLDGDMKGLLSVPGGRLAYLLQESVGFGPRIDAGLAANGIAKGTPNYFDFFLLSQAVIDPADPATMTTPLPNLQTPALLPSRLSGRVLMQEATSTSFSATGVPQNGDLVIPNSSTRYLGNALGGRGVLGFDVAPGFSQLTYADGRLPSSFMLTLNGTAVVPKTTAAATSTTAGPTEGYFQFDQPDVTHGFLIDQAHSQASIQLAQRQMVYFILTGRAIDPTVTSAALPRAAAAETGFSWQPAIPAVMRVFGR